MKLNMKLTLIVCEKAKLRMVKLTNTKSAITRSSAPLHNKAKYIVNSYTT